MHDCLAPSLIHLLPKANCKDYKPLAYIIRETSAEDKETKVLKAKSVKKYNENIFITAC
jgi:hypothetical protein